MYQIQLINMGRSWERRLEIETEKRKSYRSQSKSDLMMAPSSCSKAPVSGIVWCPEAVPAH